MRAGFGADSVTAVSPAFSGAQCRYSMKGLIRGSLQAVAMDAGHGSLSPGSTHVPPAFQLICPLNTRRHCTAPTPLGGVGISWLQALPPQTAPSAHLSPVRSLSLALGTTASQDTAAQGHLLTRPSQPLPGATQTLMTPTPGLGSPFSAPELQALGTSDSPGHSTMADQPPGVFQGKGRLMSTESIQMKYLATANRCESVFLNVELQVAGM